MAKTNLQVSTTGQSDGNGSKQSEDDFETHGEWMKLGLLGIKSGKDVYSDIVWRLGDVGRGTG
jgi:hypothetical protein